MNVCVLTTETSHHAYFVKCLKEAGYDITAIVERTGLSPPFEVSHRTDHLRDEYEISTCFDGVEKKISDLVATLVVDNVNDTASLNYLRAESPDIVVVFGTRKIEPSLIELVEDRIVNLHGGNPEQYRGLDSHLWAMYHRDFGSLVTALHRLNIRLDDGDVIIQRSIPLQRNLSFHQFRKANTQVCIEITCETLEKLALTGGIEAKPQERKGRYYSFMPSVLKDIACANFGRYVAQEND